MLQENSQRFHQARPTPPMQEPLYSLLGPLGDTPAAEAILNGTFVPPPGTDPAFVGLLPFLRRVHPPAVPLATLAEDHAAGWRKAKSQTSASPFGPTFSQMKVESTDADICELNAAMASFPFCSGYAPKGYKKGMNVMLEKILGLFLVMKLRTILLYDAEFNMSNKNLGRRMMAFAKKHGGLVEEQ